MADPPKKPPKGSEETLRDLGYAPNLPPANSTHDPPTVAGSSGWPIAGNLPRMGGGESVRETIKRSIRETEAAIANPAAPNSDWHPWPIRLCSAFVSYWGFFLVYHLEKLSITAMRLQDGTCFT